MKLHLTFMNVAARLIFLIALSHLCMNHLMIACLNLSYSILGGFYARRLSIY